jgi:alginate O-acetyltransferase complex protein AlgI
VLFNSFEFLIFFVVVFGVYWALPRLQLRNLLLLAASYYFYMSWNAKLAAVVASSSLVDYFLALGIERHKRTGRSSGGQFLWASILMNLGLLFYFKYANFFLQSLGDLLAALGAHRTMPVLEIVLPIGISFYTFEAISYMVDVHRGRTAAERNPLYFLLFITFFPRMIAGPIIRAKNFLPQLRREKRFSWARFDLGLQYVLVGFFKKLAIADRMAYLVDPVYKSPDKYNTGAIWIAVVAYSLQVYCDFSGYSDIAIGTAHMLGFKLPQNFNMPYAARNITEFWRRWHISLSTWLRDYVFISLGGSKGTRLRTCATLMLTMALCGLWHGARWNFVVFGVLQGCMMLTHRFFHEYCQQTERLKNFLESGAGIGLRVLFTYWTFIVSLVVFRSQNFANASMVFHSMFLNTKGIMVRNPIGPWSLVASFLIVFIAHATMIGGLQKKILPALATPFAGLGYSITFAATFLMKPQLQKAFIYFQF